MSFGCKPASIDPSECRFCRWWIDTYCIPAAHMPGRQTYNDADCRRHAPGTTTDGWKNPIWPRTKGSDGCGDFERFRDPDGTPNRSVQGVVVDERPADPKAAEASEAPCQT